MLTYGALHARHGPKRTFIPDHDAVSFTIVKGIEPKTSCRQIYTQNMNIYSILKLTIVSEIVSGTRILMILC